MNAFITLILLALALFFLYSGQVFFAFLAIAALAVALLLESPGGARPAQHAASGLGGTEKKAFGGEKELGERLGLFLNFLGQLFGFFWGSFGKEPEKKKEEKSVVVMKEWWR